MIHSIIKILQKNIFYIVANISGCHVHIISTCAHGVHDVTYYSISCNVDPQRTNGREVLGPNSNAADDW